MFFYIIVSNQLLLLLAQAFSWKMNRIFYIDCRLFQSFFYFYFSIQSTFQLLTNTSEWTNLFHFSPNVNNKNVKHDDNISVICHFHSKRIYLFRFFLGFAFSSISLLSTCFTIPVFRKDECTWEHTQK